MSRELRRRRTHKRASRGIGLFTLIVKALMRLGVPMGPDVLLTVQGRRTGLPRSTPVAIAEIAGRRWLVAPFGESDWVRNLRAAGGQATVTSARRERHVAARELDDAEAVAFFRDVLNPYVRGNALVRWIVRKLDGIPEDPVKAAETIIVFEVTRVRG